MAQLGPTEPSLGQQLLQIANLSSFFLSGRTGMCMMREEQNGSIELCYGTAISSAVPPCTLKCHRLCRLNIQQQLTFFLLHQQQMFSFHYTYRMFLFNTGFLKNTCDQFKYLTDKINFQPVKLLFNSSWFTYIQYIFVSKVQLLHTQIQAQSPEKVVSHLLMFCYNFFSQ